MKRYIIWSSLVVVLIVAAVAVARAEGRGWRGWCDHGWHHHGPLGYVAHELDLSQAQNSQIQSIWQTERQFLRLFTNALPKPKKWTQLQCKAIWTKARSRKLPLARVQRLQSFWL